ncbi:MAG: folate-binding protein YgfZ [Bryobacteraceae bacterium]|nr:folate-binding protein YgfZ [Bryobacteraceae bacterium]
MDQTAYQALRQRCAFIDLSGRGKIRVTGEDRVRLLHAMCTNHVQQLIPGSGCYAFFLTPQGRILADLNIFSMPDHLLLDTEPETRQRVTDHLNEYIIADDVSLHDFTSDTATIGLSGPAAEQVLNGLGAMPARADSSLVEWGQAQIAHWSYTGASGYMIFVPATEKDDLVDQLASAGVPQADMEAAEVVRLENARPRFGVDFSEAQIPQETQQMQAIHFSKGCYLGQEIVERVRSRGHVNRLLTPVRIETMDPPSPGTAVEDQGKPVGETFSAAYSPALGEVVAFAMLRAEALAGSDHDLRAAGALVKPVSYPEPTQER